MNILVLFGILQSIPQLFPFIMRIIQYSSNYSVPNAEPDPAAAVSLHTKSLMSQLDYKQVMRDAGYTEYWAEQIAKGSYTLLSPSDYIALWRRGKISENDLRLYLLRHGFKEEEIDTVKGATEYFPGAPDIVRFAVREVYTPAVIEKFRTMEDLPPRYLEEAAKAGLSKEQATNFWASHWDLPSASMGYSMYQRGIISYEELVLLLKTLDVMPYWRDKLIQLAYNPLTRVDVRRMYGEGVLSPDQLPKAYQAQGYSPENANALAEFTVRYENRETKGLTRAQVVKSYKQDLITEEELKAYLTSFGYTAEVVDFWVQQANYEKAEEEIALYSEDLTNQYLAGGRDLASIKLEMDTLGVPSSYVQGILRKIVAQKAKKLKVPAKEDLDTWITQGYIDETQWTTQMRLLGYEDWAIEKYLSVLAEKGDTAKRKYLSLAIYTRWVKARIIDAARFRAVLRDQNYGEDDIARLCAENGVEYAQP